MYGLIDLRDYSVAKTLLWTGVLSGLMTMGGKVLAVEDIQFNTDILDLNDRTNIDLSQFSRSGFILPGTYPMQVQINTQLLPEQRIPFYPPDDDPKGSQTCLSPDLVPERDSPRGTDDCQLGRGRTLHADHALKPAG